MIFVVAAGPGARSARAQSSNWQVTDAYHPFANPSDNPLPASTDGYRVEGPVTVTTSESYPNGATEAYQPNQSESPYFYSLGSSGTDTVPSTWFAENDMTSATLYPFVSASNYDSSGWEVQVNG